MQRLLAIDCDARELCFVLASAAGERVTLEAAGVLPLKGSAEEPSLPPEELGKQLQTLLARHKRSGAKVLAGVDRNSIELFAITVPPASDSELPELVLNQLTMESSNIADESVIDFIAGQGGPTESRRITAAALSKTEFARVNTVCGAAGVSPDRMLVRPYETASLFLNQRTTGGGDVLLVNVVADEVDLIVVDQVQPLFFRTVRLPAGLGDESAEQRLLDEIRRTLLVAPQSAEVGQVIEAVYVLGNSPDHNRLAQQIAKDGPAKVEVLDPFAGFTLGSDWEKQTSGRLIPLLGMLSGEARGGKHAIDFLHPRRAPKPPNRLRQLVTGLIVAALVGGGLGYYVWDSLSTADALNKRLTEELADLEALVKKMAEKKKVADAIDDWNSNSIVWLDELRDLSAKFPSGQDLVIQRLSMTPTRGGKASISFQGLAREPQVVTRMEAFLRDGRHEIQTPRVEERLQDKMYSWGFETAISLSPAKPNLEESDDEKPNVSDAKDSAAPKEPRPTKSKKSSKGRAKKNATVDQSPDQPEKKDPSSEKPNDDNRAKPDSQPVVPGEQ